jgi:zinc protease
MTIGDLKTYYATALAPGQASLRIAGAANETDAKRALAGIARGWKTPAAALPDVLPAIAPGESRVYFYDVPGAKQSVFRFGAPGPKRTDADFYPAAVMNYRLGGGGFASRLTQELREGKGFTYGISSGFGGTARKGGFLVQSGVRSNVTLEAAALARDIIADYGATYTDEDLEVSRSFLLKSQARAFESLGAKLGLLGNVADYDLPHDYARREAEIVEAMTVDRIRALAGAYLKPDAMNYVIVGDAATQSPRLEALGYGAPMLIKDRIDGSF